MIAESSREIGTNTRETGNQESESLLRHALQLQPNHQRALSYIPKCKENESFIRNSPPPPFKIDPGDRRGITTSLLYKDSRISERNWCTI